MTVHAQALAGHAEQGQQDDREGVAQQQPVTMRGIFDVGRLQAHAEAQVFGVAKATFHVLLAL
jgi:hypothetical protein